MLNVFSSFSGNVHCHSMGSHQIFNRTFTHKPVEIVSFMKESSKCIVHVYGLQVICLQRPRFDNDNISGIRSCGVNFEINHDLAITGINNHIQFIDIYQKEVKHYLATWVYWTPGACQHENIF
jgi:hypothetical protein